MASPPRATSCFQAAPASWLPAPSRDTALIWVSSLSASARPAAPATPADEESANTARRMRRALLASGKRRGRVYGLGSAKGDAAGGRFHLLPQAGEVGGQLVGGLDGPAGARAARTPPAGPARAAARRLGPARARSRTWPGRAGQVGELDRQAVPGRQLLEQRGGVAVGPVDGLQDRLRRRRGGPRRRGRAAGKPGRGGPLGVGQDRGESLLVPGGGRLVRRRSRAAGPRRRRTRPALVARSRTVPSSTPRSVRTTTRSSRRYAAAARNRPRYAAPAVGHQVLELGHDPPAVTAWAATRTRRTRACTCRTLPARTRCSGRAAAR